MPPRSKSGGTPQMNEEFQHAIELSEARSDKKIDDVKRDICELFEKVNVMNVQAAVTKTQIAVAIFLGTLVATGLAQLVVGMFAK